MWAIKKPGKGEPRFVTDLRQRNQITFDEKQPMMNQDRMREVAARAEYISKFDMRDSYFQTRMEPEQEDNNTINTPFGVFKVRIMLQGDHRAPATLIRAMTNILCHCIGKFVWVYLDDIIIYSNSMEEHICHIAIVLNELKRNRYYLNLKKCEFLCKEFELLGHLISYNDIRPLPERIRKLSDIPLPKTVTKLRKFLGIVNYFGGHLPHLATVAGPLYDVTSGEKTKVIEWTATLQQAFNTVKQLADNYVTLHPPNYDSMQHDNTKIFLTTDASKTGLGGILT